VPRWLVPTAVIAWLMLAITTLPLAPTTRLLADVGNRLACLWMLSFLLAAWWRGRASAVVPNGRWFAAACMLLLLCGISDSGKVLLREAWPSQVYLLHWGVLYLVVLMFVALIANLLQTLSHSEVSRESLAQALDAQSRALTEEFALRQRAEHAQTLAEERQRLMRDMHDGVGGQLVAVIGRLQSGSADTAAITALLRRTLDDLRLMIDSLDVACADLSVALGMLRARLDPLLAGQVQIIWRTAQLPDLPPVPPSTVLNVMRIVQESLTNALKHAGARTIQIHGEYQDMQLRLTIRDDGAGMAPHTTPGRGLLSLRSRAASIGASIDIRSADPGTQVELRLRLPSCG
jgi:signal transduction histidine kinase